MKKLFFLVLFSLTVLHPAVASPKWPSPTGHLNDFAHVVPADQAQNLENLLTQLETKTGVQLAVVTLPSVEGADIDQAAVDLFKAWGIGQKGKENGLLILLSVGDRKDRIEVGYGLEGIITDGDTGSIRRHAMEPLFREKEYGQGLTAGVMELAQLIEAGGEKNTRPANDHRDPLGFWGTIILFIVIFILISMLNRRGRGGFWGGGFYGGGWGGGFGGGGGGGFGGFGGGGSGGGGSSGSW
jgi:uncharacterized protein